MIKNKLQETILSFSLWLPKKQFPVVHKKYFPVVHKKYFPSP